MSLVDEKGRVFRTIGLHIETKHNANHMFGLRNYRQTLAYGQKTPCFWPFFDAFALIRTPTSCMPASASQHVHQAEEDRLVRIPAQQAIDQLAAGADDLTRQTHKSVHERLEFQPQPPAFLRAVLF